MKIFLDTTHLLPFFGIQTTIPQHVEQLHLLLKKPKPIGHILISDLSLIEIRWLLNSYQRKETNELKKSAFSPRFLQAINQLTNSPEISVINWYNFPIGINFAENIYKLGHNDFFDCNILGSAFAHNAILISEDKAFPELIVKLNTIYKKPTISLLTWLQFAKTYLS